MTEKRFTIVELEEETYPMTLFLDNGKEMTDINVVECLNALHEERNSMARGWDKYQAKVGYVIGKYGRMYNKQSDEFQLIECIAEELGFDLESMEAKDD